MTRIWGPVWVAHDKNRVLATRSAPRNSAGRELASNGGVVGMWYHIIRLVLAGSLSPVRPAGEAEIGRRGFRRPDGGARDLFGALTSPR